MGNIDINIVFLTAKMEVSYGAQMLGLFSNSFEFRHFDFIIVKSTAHQNGKGACKGQNFKKSPIGSAPSASKRTPYHGVCGSTHVRLANELSRYSQGAGSNPRSKIIFYFLVKIHENFSKKLYLCRYFPEKAKSLFSLSL